MNDIDRILEEIGTLDEEDINILLTEYNARCSIDITQSLIKK